MMSFQNVREKSEEGNMTFRENFYRTVYSATRILVVVPIDGHNADAIICKDQLEIKYWLLALRLLNFM